jgi:hypothetical protein
MIDLTIKSQLHSCDICKRRIPSTSIKTCVICKKELCTYCRISLTRVKRKYPDSGYTIRHKQIGNICIDCAEKKLNLKLERLNYNGS